jgi:hypothetical protein
MVTAAQMRKLALSLPDVEEKSHFEQADFRVRNKIFAGLSRDGRQGNLKLVPELQAMVLSSNPSAYAPATGAWGRSGWTMVVLEHVQSGELAELLREAHALVAPKRSVTPGQATKVGTKKVPARKSGK